MKIIKRASIMWCLFLIIAILTAGTVSALIPIYHMSACQHSDKYTYSFSVEDSLNRSVVNGYNYYWDFGDGAYSTISRPVHTYTSSGEKIATVYFYTPLGPQQLSKSVYPGV